MEEINFQMYSFPEHLNEMTAFQAIYREIDFKLPPETKMYGFVKPSDRVCRFCLRKMPAVTFRKRAHIIPEFMGNKYLVSDFECDECNALFSNYEDSLSKWLGIIMSSLGIRGKNGIPDFKVSDRATKAERVEFYDTNVTRISIGDDTKNDVAIDTETGQSSFNYTKPAYTPIKVYKALLKIALSLIPAEQVENYRPAFSYLLKTEPNPLFDGFAEIMRHDLPNNYGREVPLTMLFSAGEPGTGAPKHYFQLYFANVVLGFPLPFNTVDLLTGNFKDSIINIVHGVPLTFNKPKEVLHQVKSRNIKLTDYQQIKGQIEQVVFQADPSTLNNLVGFNPVTGEILKEGLDIKNIVGFYIGKAGQSITFPRIDKTE